MKRIYIFLMAVLMALPTIAADAIDGTENPYKQSRRGYRIILDGGTYLSLMDEDANISDDGTWIFPTDCSGLVELRFSNGFLFNNYFYLGGGVGMNYFTGSERWSIPIFAHTRVGFLNGKISPFIDGKIGCNATDEWVGIYLGGMAGIRIGLTRTTAINVGVDIKATFTGHSDDAYGHALLGLTVGYEF